MNNDNNTHNKHKDLPNDSRGLAKDNSIELLEERAVVDKQRIIESKIIATKQQRTRTVNVPIELTEEVLIIEAKYENDEARNNLQKVTLNDDISEKDIITYLEPRLSVKPQITVDGTLISLDEGPVEILLSSETATIQKQTYAVKEVDIYKDQYIHKDKVDIELSHEELDINEEKFGNKKLE